MNPILTVRQAIIIRKSKSLPKLSSLGLVLVVFHLRRRTSVGRPRYLALTGEEISQDIAQGWAETLETHIQHTKMRFESAKLFGNLFNEWLASGDSSALSVIPI
jgi:hypothetical protein